MSGWKRFDPRDKITFPDNGFYITYSVMGGQEYLDRNYLSGGSWNLMPEEVLAYISQDELIPNMEDVK